ncbi:MAG: hypothetical protein AVDCRST_MAG49-3890 [uncultured Thermomicrobiales bacterium]|uniref:Uncharacterized protein n=1 Tax=uncultured Thermomicrobiales bacterium TaxID=1645740 RepID=A0A6J4VAA8_9BACT|nr:MAG: hypothetical protein AVDCRST_MAG49-3890 [uncultured Thermomicrobiales bacterium]
MSGGFLRVQVDDLDGFKDAVFDFVTDPRPSRGGRPVIQELGDLMPDVVDVLEAMVMDGTEERQDVSDYVDAVFVGGLAVPREH